MKHDLILASASPRRKELLSAAGYTFEILVSHIEEKTEETDPVRVVEELSRQKCLHVAETISDASAVIGADTIVVCDGRILGKPADPEDAVRMLLSMQGRSHMVYTGVTLAKRASGVTTKTRTFSVGTSVRIEPMTEAVIRAYVSTGEPLDKAGSYAIQGRFARHIERIEGDYCNVVGLPLNALCRELDQWEGID